MKYIVVLGDGMADRPVDALGGKTPLEAAVTPVMDALASKGTLGTVQNVPAGMAPGSDVANLSVLGYDPTANYSGRSPLEALSVGVAMDDDDVIFRSNIVTLTEDEPYEQKTILDHSSGEISTADADVLMDAIRAEFNSDTFRFYTGTSYRHILVWKGGKVCHLEPPHDHLGKVIGDYLPQEKVLREMMEQSFEVLNNHPLNLARAAAGKNKANSLWFWGAGTKPKVQNFYEKTGLHGAMISAVDLLKGIAVGAGMKVCEVPGATGSIDTNYEGKAQAAIDALQTDDLVYVHVEASDEAGHDGNIPLKLDTIRSLDSRLLKPILEALDPEGTGRLQAAGEPVAVALLPDHPTPCHLRTHTNEPIPFAIYAPGIEPDGVMTFDEEAARKGAYGLLQGDEFIRTFMGITDPAAAQG